MIPKPAWLVPAFALAAFLYSSVGHGGASGYLALGTLAGLPREDLVPMALILNVAVAGIAAVNFRAHFRRDLFLPLIATSIPAAFVGARVHLSSAVFAGLLGWALFWSGLRLSWPRKAADDGASHSLAPLGAAQKWAGLPACGLAIGFVSGMLGIGGGVFLSPLLLFWRWANIKQTAALSSTFIVVNSVSGLLSWSGHGRFPDSSTLAFAAAAIVGGVLGAHVGSKRLSSKKLALMLGGVLMLAAAKLLVTAVS